MALLHLFRKCNQRCVFCSYPQEDGGGARESLKDWLREICSMPTGLVQISGGEPLLAGADKLQILLAAIKKIGHGVELQSNALLAASMTVSDIRKIALALNAAAGYFNVNFPASNAALDFKITRARRGFSRRLAGVNRLIKWGCRVRLTYVINTLNYTDPPAFVSFMARELGGAAWLQFSYIKGIGRASGAGFLPEYEVVRPFLMQALSACRENGIHCEVDHIPPCFLGEFYRLSVDIKKMRDGLKGPHLDEKKHVPACRGCRFFNLCPGPRKDYILVHKKI